MSDEVTAVHEATFAREVLQSTVPVLVDFWAPWCGPCRVVAPILDELARSRAGQLRVVKINVDENQAVANGFRVTSLPTFLLFRDGQVADRLLGAMPRASFESFLERHLGAATAAPGTATR